jgi:hypothetical protein
MLLLWCVKRDPRSMSAPGHELMVVNFFPEVKEFERRAAALNSVPVAL